MQKFALLLACVLACAGSLVACKAGNPPMQVQRFEAGKYPAQLSAWQLFSKQDNTLRRASDTLVYDLNTPLFADYTLKLRTISLPEGTQANYSDDAVLDFPVGTVISKTFYYDTRDVPLAEQASERGGLFKTAAANLSTTTNNIRLLETRILVRDATGWQALPYVWNDTQTDARLSITGAIKDIGDNIYVVPSKDECASCHAVGREKVLHPIGPKARHLHRTASDNTAQSASSLLALVDRGWLDAAPVSAALATNTLKANAIWQNGSDLSQLSDADLDHHARSYLDANCGHCHNPQGSADTSHLYLDYTNHPARALGRCKPPIAAGKGTGGNLYSITPGKPAESILSFRMASTDPGAMMPETGRTRVHAEGVALVEEWIRRQEGSCLTEI